MNTYTALILINGLTEVIEVKANNLKNAKVEAEKVSTVICISKNDGSKIYF